MYRRLAFGDACTFWAFILVLEIKMKKDIHPTYFPEAKATCGCGTTFVIGSTTEKIEVEICSNCHPFYTGKEKIIDTAGKVEKFKAKREAASKAPKKAKKVRRKNAKDDSESAGKRKFKEKVVGKKKAKKVAKKTKKVAKKATVKK
ncbi:MAG: 50S ribosomal protein L31 [bacterium]|nr:50S ribosomal protein L31 [bacterium]